MMWLKKWSDKKWTTASCWPPVIFPQRNNLHYDDRVEGPAEIHLRRWEVKIAKGYKWSKEARGQLCDRIAVAWNRITASFFFLSNKRTVLPHFQKSFPRQWSQRLVFVLMPCLWCCSCHSPKSPGYYKCCPCMQLHTAAITALSLNCLHLINMWLLTAVEIK